MKEQADRYNDGKTRWSLLDLMALRPYAEGCNSWANVNWELLQETVKVMEFGAKKYDRDNWKKGMSYNSVADSFLRHLHEIVKGNLHDSETGLSQWSHLMCNLMFLSRYTRCNPELDDRTHTSIVVNTRSITSMTGCIDYMYDLMGGFLSGAEYTSTGTSVLGELMVTVGFGYST